MCKFKVESSANPRGFGALGSLTCRRHGTSRAYVRLLRLFGILENHMREVYLPHIGQNYLCESPLYLLTGPRDLRVSKTAPRYPYRSFCICRAQA